MARRLYVALCLLAAAAPAACRPAPPPVARHVVLVTLDTLRADHVGVYGGDVETPHLDRLAREGALVEQASAHVPLTRPSHVALMTGLLPPETGVRDNLSPLVRLETPLLAEVFRRAGFATAAFVSSVVVSAEASGLDRGFGVYADDFTADPTSPGFLDSAQKRGDETLAEAVAWLEEQGRAGGDRRLFLWLHLYDPHDPYEPPAPYASRYADRPYAGEVAWTDELVGRLDTALERLGLAADTLLVVTSDHGEGLGEHGELLHGFFAYESTLRVPLLIRGPGIEPGLRLAQVVGLVDLYPTLLALAGIAPPAGVELAGRNLAPALIETRELPEAVLYAETLVPRLHFGWSDLRVARRGRFKYIQAPRPELYDLARDPGETQNLFAQERRRARELAGTLTAFAERAEESGQAPGALSEELRAQLQALGYLGGGSPAETASPGADPKDKIEDFRFANQALREGLARLREKDFEGAVARLSELSARGIESAEIRLYLGRAELGRARPRKAAEHFQAAAEREPTSTGAWLGLAEARLAAGEAEGALKVLRDGQIFLPRAAALRREEARLLVASGRPGEARRALEAALPLAPEDAHLRAALAEVLRGLGEVEQAARRLGEAVELEPEEASYHNALGMTLGGLGRLAESEHAFRQAVRLAPEDPRYAYNLGLAIARLGRPEEARPLFERALALEPGFAPARERLAELGKRVP